MTRTRHIARPADGTLRVSDSARLQRPDLDFEPTRRLAA